MLLFLSTVHSCETKDDGPEVSLCALTRIREKIRFGNRIPLLWGEAFAVEPLLCAEKRLRRRRTASRRRPRDFGTSMRNAPKYASPPEWIRLKQKVGVNVFTLFWV